MKPSLFTRHLERTFPEFKDLTFLSVVKQCLSSNAWTSWDVFPMEVARKPPSKINKLINYLISQIFLLTYITTFEPETPAGHPKYRKTQIVA